MHKLSNCFALAVFVCLARLAGGKPTPATRRSHRKTAASTTASVCRISTSL